MRGIRRRGKKWKISFEVDSNLKTVTHSDHMIAWQHASLILFHTNFGINFVLYCVSGQNFRKALAGLCCPRRQRTNETTRVTGK
ncbi:conserved hypothetical protein [Pediculus humanus corporis]|uniref:Uncharacterized protein n=1 Tax=Pediculus humanus subsp. corporis TaxID=121224 RepID=E0VZU4_PEDHC|nr:uncharacterized protein Phum_PHUM538520 [Pediculus humanus corporis]EEB18900.1 conserved hypothetical protein [Pediculus humanus corporis]